MRLHQMRRNRRRGLPVALAIACVAAVTGAVVMRGRLRRLALEAIADAALKRNVGARGLKIIIEELMLEIMYMVPSQDAISECVITREVVELRSQPITLYRKAG